MTTMITRPWKLERDAPPFEDNEIKYPENLVRYFLNEYTKKGDKIFDPFTGLGTTLFTAEEMGRVPFGFEAEQKKFEWVAGQLENWTHLIHDDTGNLNKYDLPKMDFVMTSPPYMPRHHKWNPLYGGDPKYAGYDAYLKRMVFIFGNVAKIMKKNATLVTQIDNLKHGRVFTPLVHDVNNCISKHFVQTDEVIVQWKNAKPDYPYTHCLVFRKK